MLKPWLPESAIEWLDAEVQEDWRIFECGSGGSTLFFAGRVRGVGTLESVEHDPRWYPKIREELVQQDWDYRSYVKYYGVMAQEEEYLAPVVAAPILHYDLFVVDGRHRVKCFEQAVQKTRPGGWILFDNFLRERYTESWRLVRELGWNVHLFLWTDDEVGKNGEIKTPKAVWHCALIEVPGDGETQERKAEDLDND